MLKFFFRFFGFLLKNVVGWVMPASGGMWLILMRPITNAVIDRVALSPFGNMITIDEKYSRLPSATQRCLNRDVVPVNEANHHFGQQKVYLCLSGGFTSITYKKH